MSQTSSRKSSSKARNVTPKDDEVKIIKIPKVTQESEDDMLTVSSSSHEGFFSSDSSETEEEEEEEEKEEKEEKKTPASRVFKTIRTCPQVKTTMV